ncbi:MAG: hypothetical protein IKL99_06565, partial [Oscillospiraceae bacterium]|nr:hypothetical protein [Oscillospiraceae bacterium]
MGHIQRCFCRERAELKINGTLAKHTSVRCVMNVPVNKPLYGGTRCKNFLRRTPGMYPDVLVPMRADGLVTVYDCATAALFFEVDIPKDFAPGESVIEIKLSHKGKELPLTLTVDVIDAIIPENELYFTQWFHYDCLASYYNVDVFSEEHWRIIENFVKTAVKNGINLLLTPLFTPPLDTARGGERRTVQLVGVRLDGGKYSFDFTLLDRFIDMCDRCGVKYFEIAHLFTQWGA